MSESAASARATDVERELDAIADELYALRPDEFAGARDERVRQARADGQQALARELAKLRRPTQSAWLINLLWRDQREIMEQLFELAAELTRATAAVSGPELRSLTAQRRELESALLRRAEALARQAGVDVSASTAREAQETLAAALAQSDVADEVRSGRLVKPASYAGFGTFGAGAPAVAAPRREPREPAAPAGEQKSNVLELRAAQRARERREAAERAVTEARAAVEAATSTLDQHREQAEAAEQHHQSLRQRIDEVQAQLRELQSEVVAADRDARAAAHRRDQAEKEHAAALRTLQRAEQELESLA